MEGLALGPGKCMFLCDLDWQEAIEHPKPRAPVYPGYGVRQTNNCWFSHDATKIQTKKLSILPRFYFHDVLEQLKSNFHTNFRFKTVLGFLKEYDWKSKLLLACVASVSNRVTARKLEREQKKNKRFFCSRPNFLDELARKRLLRRLSFCVTGGFTWRPRELSCRLKKYLFQEILLSKKFVS